MADRESTTDVVEPIRRSTRERPFVPGGYCLKCDHRIDLSGERRCPECGEEFDPRETRLRYSRNDRRIAVAKLTLKRAIIACTAVILLLLALLVVAVLFLFYDVVFYDAKFNRAQDVIEGIPGVTIVDSWQHRDLTMEDFGFTIQLADGQLIDVNFYDGTPEKETWRKARVRAHVQEVIDKASADSKSPEQ